MRVSPESSVTLSVDVPVLPDAKVKVAGLNVITGGSVSGTITSAITVAVKVASDEFPASSLTVAVQTTVVSTLTAGAVKVPPAKLPPFVQLTSGLPKMATLSVADKADAAVSPESNVNVVALNETAGASVSGVIVTFNVAVPEFPAASPAVAVHALVVAVVTTGAVNVPPAKLPPLVQLTVGPVVTPVLSVAVTLAAPVVPPVSDNVVGLNVTEGAAVSATGAGGGGVTPPLEDDPPPPQATAPKATLLSASVRKSGLMIIKGSNFKNGYRGQGELTLNKAKLLVTFTLIYSNLSP